MESYQSKSLHTQGIILLAALVVQYALGMYVNLFIQFPQNMSVTQSWEFSWKQPSLAAHIILGILLLFASIVFIVQVFRKHNAVWKIPSVIGFLGILLAGFGGSSFIPTQSNAYSYVMSLAFIVSLIAYMWGIVFDQKEGIS